MNLNLTHHPLNSTYSMIKKCIEKRVHRIFLPQICIANTYIIFFNFNSLSWYNNVIQRGLL